MLTRSTTKPDDDLADLLTVDDVAGLLHIHPGSVRRWLTAGVLPSVRIGGRRYIPRAAIARRVDAALADWHDQAGVP